jgi:cation diffusion facilitator family transporter
MTAKFGHRRSSQAVIYASIAGNVLVALTKCIAAYFTGSSAMLSEAIHSIADTGNGFVVLYGIHRAAAQPDREHPLGYGREIYFWSFVVAVLLFAGGAGLSFYEGVHQIMTRDPVQNVGVVYAVLGVSLVFDGATWAMALYNFKGEKGLSQLLAAVRKSKDPPSFIVIFEDTASIFGVLTAFIGVYCSVLLNMPVLDGVASIVIGLVLVLTASTLAYETKSLLIGERAHQEIIDAIVLLAERIPGVSHANGILAVHLAPQQILVALSLEFSDELRTPDIESKIVELEKHVRQSHPDVIALFIKPQSPAGYRDSIARRAMKPPN